MLVLNLPFKALMFLTLMRPSLVLFLVLWLKLVKDFLKVRSEERRVGKECRYRVSPYHSKKKEGSSRRRNTRQSIHCDSYCGYSKGVHAHVPHGLIVTSQR